MKKKRINKFIRNFIENYHITKILNKYKTFLYKWKNKKLMKTIRYKSLSNKWINYKKD